MPTTTGLFRQPSKSLARENSLLYTQKMLLAEENADLQKEINYVFSFFEGSTPEPDAYLPNLSNLDPREYWADAFQSELSPIQRSTSQDLLGLDDLSPAALSLRTSKANELAKHAFRSTAPDVDVQGLSQERPQVVQMKDLELYAIPEVEEPEVERDEDGDMEEVTFWGESGGQQQQQQKEKEKEKDNWDDLGPVLKAWLKSVNPEDGKTNKKDSTAKPASATSLPSTSQITAHLKHRKQTTFSSPVRPSQSSMRPVSAPIRPLSSPMRPFSPPSPPSSSSATSSQDSQFSPSLFSDDLPESSDEEDDYVPSFSSPRKRAVRPQQNVHVHSERARKRSRPSTARTSVASSSPSSSDHSRLYCLFVGCTDKPAGFSNVRDRNRHMEIHFPGRQQPCCAACGKSMSRPDSVKRHQNSAAGKACKVKLLDRPGATVVPKPWDVSPWLQELRFPPLNDPLYQVAVDMQRQAGLMPGAPTVILQLIVDRLRQPNVTSRPLRSTSQPALFIMRVAPIFAGLFAVATSSAVAITIPVHARGYDDANAVAARDYHHNLVVRDVLQALYARHELFEPTLNARSLPVDPALSTTGIYRRTPSLHRVTANSNLRATQQRQAGQAEAGLLSPAKISNTPSPGPAPAAASKPGAAEPQPEPERPATPPERPAASPE
ncbi:hypothetical protein EIP91_007504, partial [Steccherinum ochraceum]